jgi:hypothetical protein
MGVENILVQECVMTQENASDYILLFADAQSCPLLKEYAVSFFLLLLDVERTVSGQCTENLVRVRIAYFLTATQIIHASGNVRKS